MSLIHFDGFDKYNSSADILSGGWQTAVVSSISTGIFRTGTRSVYFNSSGQTLDYRLKAADEHATLIVGFAYYRTPYALSDVLYFRSDAEATNHIVISIPTDGSLRVNRGTYNGTQLANTAIGLLPDNTWAYIECLVTLSDTVGVVKVRVNGTEVINYTGDTKNAGTKTVFDTVTIGAFAVSTRWYLDDFYLCNGAGTINNTFLGECRVRALYPNGNGSSSQGVGSDANSTDNYLLVDDPVPSTGTADYVNFVDTGNKDLYTYQDVPDTSGTVAGVLLGSYAQKTDTGVRGMANIVNIGGTDYPSADIVLGTGSYAFQRTLYENNPATGVPWTRAEVNAAQFGAKAT